MTIAVVGKYIKHNDAYKSVYESLDHAGIALASRVVVRKVEAEEIEREGAERVLSGMDGILVPGGFGYRGIAGKIEAIRFARERQMPFFGICLGLQCAVIEFARNVVGLAGRQHAPRSTATAATRWSACSTSSTPSPTWAARCGWGRIRARWRRAAGPTQAYGSLLVHERHRHRYEFNNQYRQQFAAHGLVVSGTSPGRQAGGGDRAARPSVVRGGAVPSRSSSRSRRRPHPLFRGFVKAALERREAKKS